MTRIGIAALVAATVISAAMLGALTACSEPPSSNQPASASKPAEAAASGWEVAADAASDALSAPPEHNWISYQNGEYAYTVSISENEKKAGQAAEKVIMYRYLGFRNGAYTLFMPADGAIATCQNPCTVITIGSGTGAEHFAYSPESVIGAAFQDAINGQLVPWRPPPRSAESPSPADSDSAPPQTAAPDDGPPAVATTPL